MDHVGKLPPGGPDVPVRGEPLRYGKIIGERVADLDLFEHTVMIGMPAFDGRSTSRNTCVESLALIENISTSTRAFRMACVMEAAQ
jgi:hypothetical protein